MPSDEAMRCCFCDWHMELRVHVVKIYCGEYHRRVGFREECFPDGSHEKYAHASCVGERFSPATEENNRFCPYCKDDIPGGPAFSFWSGMFDGSVRWTRGPIYVCAACGIDSIGGGDVDEAQRVLGYPDPRAFGVG